jgi:hypothetical protein
MLGRWSLYTRFLATKSIAAGDEDSKLHLPAFILHSTLQKKVTDLLIEPFNLLATFFFRRSVEKSFQMDEPPSDLTLNPNKVLGSSPPFITSAVDDIMYIVNQVLQRTLATSQRAVVTSVIPSIGRVLGGDFFGMEQRKMRDESYPKAAIQGALPPETLIIQFLVLINNLDVSTDYVKRIVNTCLGQANSALADSFPFGNESLLVEKTLRSMESGFATKTAELINEAVEVMLKQVMRPRLRPVLIETFRDVDYNISPENPTLAGDDDPPDTADLVAQRFERGWQSFTLPIKRIATANIYDRLLTLTVTYLARTLEKRLWSYYGRVTELGAVRLDRDVAGIMAAAVRGGKYELRDAFARCVQMTLIMNMEDDEWEGVEKMKGEQLDAATGVRWKLDADERKRARALVKDRA